MFGNWERVYTILVDAITDDPITNLASREGGNPTQHAFNLTGLPPRVDSRLLTAAARATRDASLKQLLGAVA